MGLLIADITGYLYTTKQYYNENAPLVTQIQNVFILTAAVCNDNRVSYVIINVTYYSIEGNKCMLKDVD